MLKSKFVHFIIALQVLLIPAFTKTEKYFHILPLLPEKNCIQGLSCASPLSSSTFDCRGIEATITKNLTSNMNITWFYDEKDQFYYPSEEFKDREKRYIDEQLGLADTTVAEQDNNNVLYTYPYFEITHDMMITSGRPYPGYLMLNCGLTKYKFEIFNSGGFELSRYIPDIIIWHPESPE